MEFNGAKVALFLGDRLAVILREDIAGLPFAGHWDFPGGGREGDETPFACMARECFEELGLHVAARHVVWSRSFVRDAPAQGIAWFFVAHLPATAARDVVFGDEGERWTLMRPETFLAHPRAIPAFQTRLRIYLKDAGQDNL